MTHARIPDFSQPVHSRPVRTAAADVEGLPHAEDALTVTAGVLAIIGMIVGGLVLIACAVLL